MKSRFRFLVAIILALGLIGSLSGCSHVSKKDKAEIVDFYINFAHDATSLDNKQINDVYSDLAAQDFKGQNANNVREKMFASFNKINPDLFNSVYLEDSSYTEVGQAYATILLMSLATGGTGVNVTMPADAVSSYKDEKLGKTVYEIDRKEITATIPEPLAGKITRTKKTGLAPVKLIKVDDHWKVLADANMLSEIGVPLSEKIAGPTVEKAKKK